MIIISKIRRRVKIVNPNGENETVLRFEDLSFEINLSVPLTDVYDVILRCHHFIDDYEIKKSAIFMFKTECSKTYLIVGHNESFIIYDDEHKTIKFDCDGLSIILGLINSIRINLDSFVKYSCKNFNDFTDEKKEEQMRRMIHSFEKDFDRYDDEGVF